MSQPKNSKNFDINLVEIKHSKDISPDEIQKVYMSVGWQYRDSQDIKKAIENSLLVTSAVYKNKIIGVARATGDGVYNATIWDVAVKPKYQRQGIGTLIMDSMINKLSDYDIPLITLYTSYTKKFFYSKLGFDYNLTQVIGMYIKNKQYK